MRVHGGSSLCDELTLATEQHIGEIWALCSERPVDCLLYYLFGIGDEPTEEVEAGGAEDSAGNAVSDGADEPDADKPLRRLLEAFTAEANLLVIEDVYFDIDYRSEFSKTHELSFAAKSPDTSRWHFFQGSVPKSNRHLRDAVKRAKSYFGYTVIRPQSVGRVGRSIVSPNSKTIELAPSTTLAEQVRTIVAEPVQVFGVPLVARGVPFMEQDGHLLRCPHVAAWMCHYAAVLRGFVPRRPSGQFHGAVEPTEAFGRPYPSEGLSTFSLCATLRVVDLPPEALDADTLRKSRTFHWQDRKLFVDAVKKASKDEARKLWVRENLTATICRYLNSAMPAILLRLPESEGAVGHAQVVVGYLRDVDLAKPKIASAESTHSDVVAFIVSDDQDGPYEIVSVENLVDEYTSERCDESSVVIPLPRSIWLSGDSAEQAAATWIDAVAKSGMKDEVTRLTEGAAPSKRAEVSRAVDDFCERILQSEGRHFAVRSYVKPGSDFKSDLSSRVGEPKLTRHLGHLQLPKYVWVSEVIDRELRAADHPSVRATIIFDATAVHLEGRSQYEDIEPLLIHIPGLAFVVPQFDGVSFAGVGWFLTSTEPYYTGRWHYRHNQNPQVGLHSKLAAAGST